MYDDDNSGYLDREEAYKFVKESIQVSDDNDGDESKEGLNKLGIKVSFVDIEKKEKEEEMT